MARLNITDFIDLGTIGYPTAGSWQVALDAEFTQIIDESLNDTDNIFTWNTPLPKMDGSGFYADLDVLYARVKLHVHDDVSDWYVLVPGNQNDQTFNLTENGVVIRTFNSLIEGIN